VCSALTAPTNGGISYDSAVPYTGGTVAQYSCDAGYFLVGVSMRSCGGNGLNTVGVWDGSAPTCSRMLIQIDISMFVDFVVVINLSTT